MPSTAGSAEAARKPVTARVSAVPASGARPMGHRTAPAANGTAAKVSGSPIAAGSSPKPAATAPTASGRPRAKPQSRRGSSRRKVSASTRTK